MKSKLSSLITMLLVSLFCDLNLWSLVSSTCLQYELPSSSVYALILVESQGGDAIRYHKQQQPLMMNDKDQSFP